MKEKLVIVVAGCTGTGKTKLGVELSKRYNGEVISADSMQIYKGLDVITNKVTTHEADGVIHHCIDFVSPHEQYTVQKYLLHTLPIIEDILKRGKLPIIVGGTAYYIEALLWNFTLPLHLKIPEMISDENLSILNHDDLSCYEKLQRIDPKTAARLHPCDSRKIERSLDIFRHYGICHSTLLEEQHNGKEDCRGNLRWDRVLLFSMECCQKTLDKRLDDRVDKMLELGLCQELEEASRYEGSCSGLLGQVIGYKEFQRYLSLKHAGCTDSVEINEALNEGLEKMKTITRRYSRKQLRWIKQRLSQSVANYHYVRLDTTFPEEWETQISKTAREIIEMFLCGKLKSEANDMPQASMISKTCNMCEITCIGDVSFTAHMKSRKHRRRKAYLKQKPLYDKFIADSKTLV